MFGILRSPFRENRIFGILALAVLAVPLLFSVYAYENFESVKYPLFLIFTSWAFLVFLKKIKISTSGIFSIRFHKPVFGILLLLWLFALLSTLSSFDLLNSFFGFYYRFTGSFLFWSCWIVFVFLLLQILNKERLSFLSKLLVFDAGIIALLGFIQSMGVAFYEGLTIAGFIRAPSLLGNPNFSSLFLVGVCPLALALLYKSERFAFRAYYAVVAFFSIFTILVLASRAAILGLLASFVIGLGLLAWTKFGKQFLLKIVLTFGLFAVLGLFVLQVSRGGSFFETLDFSETNTKLRLQVWSQSLSVISEFPWLGGGPGTFHILFEQSRGSDLAGQGGIFDDAHNLYLQLAATSGLPFLLVFLILFCLAAFLAVKKLKTTPDIQAYSFLVGLSGVLVGAAFNPVPLSLYLLLGVLFAGLTYESTQQFQFKIPIVFRLPVGLFAFFILAFGFAVIVSEHIFFYGYQKYFEDDFKQARVLSNLALKINPTNQLYYLYKAGSAIRFNQQPDKIVPEIQRVVELHPQQAGSFVMASNLYHLWYMQNNESEHLEKAIINLERALRMDPYFAERYGQLGLYYYESGDLISAKENLNRCLSLEETYFPAWMLLAKIYQLENDRPKALFALEKAYKLQPNIFQVRQIWSMAKNTQEIQAVPIEILIGRGTLE